MKPLSRSAVRQIQTYVANHGRPLETASWEWGYDEDHWQQARQQWIGVLACNHLAILKAFSQIAEAD